MVKSLHHARLIEWLQPDRRPEDVFSAAYRLCTLKDTGAKLPGFEDYSHLIRGDPAYFGGSDLAYGALRVVHHLTPSWFSGNVLVFLRLKCAGRSSLTSCPQHAGVFRDCFWVAKVPVRGTVVG